MKETFGQRFARLRKRQGLKQEEIASKVNISAQAVSKWENDLSAPDIMILPLLSDILKVSLDELLGKEVAETKIVSEEDRKDINQMLLTIDIENTTNDKVKINLPISLIKACIDSGVGLPNIDGKNSLNNIDFDHIFKMVEAGVIGQLLEITTGNGEKITVYVK